MVASTPARAPARLDALTGLRFWFAFLVVMHHSLEHWFGHAVYPIADFGYIGVDFFFVLSGFVLTWSWRPELPTRRFWWNRVARIWPLHLTTLLLAVAFVAEDIARPGVIGTVANVLLLQAWFPARDTYFGYNAVAWSLSCEVFFYLAFPLLVRGLAGLSARRRGVVAVGVSVALCLYPGVFSLTVAPRDPAGWEWTTYVLPAWRLGEFVIGILAALAIRDGWRPPMRGRVALTVAAVAATALLGLGLHWGHLPNRPMVEVVGMLAVAGVISVIAADELAGRRRVLASRLMVSLGSASYALYLCHALLYGWVVRRWSDAGAGVGRGVGWAAYVVAAVALAYLLHRLVEVPCERWLRHRGAEMFQPRRVPVEPYPDDARRELVDVR